MRCWISVAAAVLAAWGAAGCGWKMVETPIKVRGEVVDAGTKAPIEGAWIDIADDREKLDLKLHTATVTDARGRFDATFGYYCDRWMWFGIPVWWLPVTPERIYVEVSQNGYRTRVREVDYRAICPLKGKEAPPVDLEPVALHRLSPSKRPSRPEERE